MFFSAKMSTTTTSSLNNSTHSSANNVTGVKRGISAALSAIVDPPSAFIQELFIKTSNLEGQTPRGAMADQFYEFQTHEDVVSGRRLILLPLEGPITWASLVDGELVVMGVKVDLPGPEGGLVLTVLGVTGGEAMPKGWPEEMRLKDIPDHLVTVKQSPSGFPSVAEMAVQQVIEGRQRQGATASRGASSSGGSSVGSDVLKKYAGCRVHDLNGDSHDLLNKEGAARRVEQLSVLVREMAPERREVLCPDLVFSMTLFWSECMRHIDRKQDPRDPLYSIAGMKDIQHLPVMKDPAMLQYHLLEGSRRWTGRGVYVISRSWAANGGIAWRSHARGTYFVLSRPG